MKRAMAILLVVVLLLLSACGSPVTPEVRRETAREAAMEIITELEEILLAMGQDSDFDGGLSEQALEEEIRRVRVAAPGEYDLDPSDYAQELTEELANRKSWERDKKMMEDALNPVEYFCGCRIREDGFLTVFVRTEPVPQVKGLFRALTQHPEVLVFEQRKLSEAAEELDTLAKYLKHNYPEAKWTDVRDGRYAVVVALTWWEDEKHLKEIHQLMHEKKWNFINEWIPVVPWPYEVEE